MPRNTQCSLTLSNNIGTTPSAPPSTYLFTDQLEAPRGSAGIAPSVQHHPERVYLHGGAEVSRRGAGLSHRGADVDLQQPGPQISAQHEVGPVELEAALAGFHLLLRRLQGSDYGLLHARRRHRVPVCSAALLMQKSPELGAGPHIVAWHRRVAVVGRLKVLLDGVVAQMDGAEDHSRDMKASAARSCLLLPVSSHPVITLVCLIYSPVRNTGVQRCCTLYFCSKPKSQAFFSRFRSYFEGPTFSSTCFPVGLPFSPIQNLGGERLSGEPQVAVPVEPHGQRVPVGHQEPLAQVKLGAVDQ